MSLTKVTKIKTYVAPPTEQWTKESSLNAFAALNTHLWNSWPGQTVRVVVDWMPFDRPSDKKSRSTSAFLSTPCLARTRTLHDSLGGIGGRTARTTIHLGSIASFAGNYLSRLFGGYF